MEKDNIKNIAKLLKADQDYLTSIKDNLELKTGKKDIFENIIQRNKTIGDNIIKNLGVQNQTPTAIFTKAFQNIETIDSKLKNLLNNPNYHDMESCNSYINFVTKLNPLKSGLFLKESKAIELLKTNQPQKVLDYLKLNNIDEALKKYSVFEIFASLRFLEGSDWLNNVFFKEYEKLSPADFEERQIQIIAIDKIWQEAARPFVQKKWHNISHLKELGVIFILPLSAGAPGEVIRTISLLLHYMEEVPFYSKIFKNIIQNKDSFAQNFTSLLRGDVYDEIPEEKSNKIAWLVIQRYLAKDDEYDWRLFYPHINTEGLLWYKAHQNLMKIEDVPEIKVWQAGIFKNQKVIDRTGAGDAFGSGFVAGLIHTKENNLQNPQDANIKQAIILGSANATSVVEKYGAKDGILTYKEFKNSHRWNLLPIKVTTL